MPTKIRMVQVLRYYQAPEINLALKMMIAENIGRP